MKSRKARMNCTECMNCLRHELQPAVALWGSFASEHYNCYVINPTVRRARCPHRAIGLPHSLAAGWRQPALRTISRRDGAWSATPHPFVSLCSTFPLTGESLRARPHLQRAIRESPLHPHKLKFGKPMQEKYTRIIVTQISILLLKYYALYIII